MSLRSGLRLRACLSTALLLMPAATHLSAQVPARPATVLGSVVDTTELVLSDAEIALKTGSGAVLITGSSGPDGRFVLEGVPAGGPYSVQARKIGYGPAEIAAVHLEPGDTLPVRFRLPAGPTVLPEITAKGKGAPLSRRRITAGEFNPRNAPSALAVLGKYKPDMLGDPTVCPDAPAEPLWREQVSTAAGARDRFGGSRAGFLGRAPRRWWLDSLNNVQSDPYSPYVQRVYVNGIRRDYPDRSPLVVLRELPSRHVAQMYYADCNDTAVPVDKRHSIFVVLKPPSPEDQRLLLRRLMPDSLPAE